MRISDNPTSLVNRPLDDDQRDSSLHFIVRTASEGRVAETTLVDIVSVLLQGKAEPACKNANGRSAFDLLTELDLLHKYSKLAKLLSPLPIAVGKKKKHT